MRKFRKFLLTSVLDLAIIAIAIGLVAMTRAPSITVPEEELIFPPEVMAPQEQIGCQAMVQNFCGQLYSPDAQGNLQIRDTTQSYRTALGSTRNDFDAARYAFHKARLQKRQLLPRDLKASLERREFFSHLSRLLSRPARSKMDIESKFEFEDLESRVDSVWSLAIKETVSRRIERRFPGTFRLKNAEVPQHIDIEVSRVRGKLWAEISLALWKGHPNWKSVEDDFENLKAAYIEVIDGLKLTSPVKAAWKLKLQSIRLALPGEDPVTANQECISTTRNAYYYRYLNSVTVCAGYFTGGGQILTLAHELAHSLDFSSRMIDLQQSSTLMERLHSLKADVCSTKPDFDCGSWTEFKSAFDENLKSLPASDFEAREVHSCLHKASLSRELDDEVIEEKASDSIRKRFSEFATNSTYFRLTNPEIKNAKGHLVKNPSYLNPCAGEVWDIGKYALDSDFVSLVFFTAAYRCSEEQGAARLRAAIIESKEMNERLLASVMKSEGPFSARDELQSEGYSSPSTERFADRIGSYAVAKYLEKFPSVESRRAIYLASSFWLCEKPTLKAENLDQFKALNEFIIDRGAHAESDSRIADWLSPPIREALHCTKDFDMPVCSALESE